MAHCTILQKQRREEQSHHSLQKMAVWWGRRIRPSSSFSFFPPSSGPSPAVWPSDPRCSAQRTPFSLLPHLWPFRHRSHRHFPRRQHHLVPVADPQLQSRRSTHKTLIHHTLMEPNPCLNNLQASGVLGNDVARWKFSRIFLFFHVMFVIKAQRSHHCTDKSLILKWEEF